MIALVREHAGETVLAVANLAPEPRSLDLDLTRFQRNRAVPVLGGSALPLEQMQAQLTLGPYEYRWWCFE